MQCSDVTAGPFLTITLVLQAECDLGAMAGPDVSACCRLCSRNPQCSGFTHYGSMCYLKTCTGEEDTSLPEGAVVDGHGPCCNSRAHVLSGWPWLHASRDLHLAPVPSLTLCMSVYVCVVLLVAAEPGHNVQALEGAVSGLKLR